MYQIFAGLFTEGSTDIRFLESVVQRTFLEHIALDCRKEIEITLIPIIIEKQGLGFVEQVLLASKMGLQEFGITLICVHTDADEASSAEAYKNKINPAHKELQKKNSADYCQMLIPIIPIRETEAWMLADKQLFIEELGTKLTEVELGINGNPETFTNPKAVIENAIRKASENLPRKRRKELKISDLYLPLGQSIAIEKLQNFASFVDFENKIKAFLVR